MKRVTVWFVLAVAVQVAILVAVPARQIRTLATGRSILLKTAPVDPYNVMSGYYVNLSYTISRAEGAPGWAAVPDGSTGYVVLRQSPDGTWEVESLQTTPPAAAEQKVFITGQKQGGSMIYGIESYYIPEEARNIIASDLRAYSKDAKAEVRLDSSGHAAIVRLLIQDRVYAY